MKGIAHHLRATDLLLDFSSQIAWHKMRNIIAHSLVIVGVFTVLHLQSWLCSYKRWLKRIVVPITIIQNMNWIGLSFSYSWPYSAMIRGCKWWWASCNAASHTNSYYKNLGKVCLEVRTRQVPTWEHGSTWAIQALLPKHGAFSSDLHISRNHLRGTY
jgi:hypothetical protein